MPDLKFDNILQKPVQYIDDDELKALNEKGFDVPEGAVYIPVSLSKNPETFRKIIEISEALPDIPVEEVTDLVKSYMNPDAVNIDIEKFTELFPGVPGERVLSDIQAGVPLSHETAKMLIENNVLYPAQDSLKFKKLLPFLGVPVIPTKKAKSSKTVKVVNRVDANVATFGIAGLVKKIAANKKKKKDNFVPFITAGIAAGSAGIKLIKKAKAKKKAKKAAASAKTQQQAASLKAAEAAKIAAQQEEVIIEMPSVKTELPKAVTTAQKKKQAGMFDWFFDIFK